jgi:hypothetical protein
MNEPMFSLDDDHGPRRRFAAPKWRIDPAPKRAPAAFAAPIAARLAAAAKAS